MSNTLIEALKVARGAFEIMLVQGKIEECHGVMPRVRIKEIDEAIASVKQSSEISVNEDEVERLAKIMWDASIQHPFTQKWEDVKAGIQLQIITMARAAIKAMSPKREQGKIPGIEQIADLIWQKIQPGESGISRDKIAEIIRESLPVREIVDLPKVRNLLKTIQDQYRHNGVNGIEIMYSLATEALAGLYLKDTANINQPPICDKYVTEGAARFIDCCDDNGKCRYSYPIDNMTDKDF